MFFCYIDVQEYCLGSGEDPMIKYRKIYQDIKDRIQNGVYPVGEKLPEGHRLAQEFDCSELTIKKSLDILVAEGFIVRKRGSGSYVKMNKSKQGSHVSNNYLSGCQFFEAEEGQTVTARVLKFGAIQAGEEIAEKVQCRPTDLVYQIERVRLVDDIPYHIEYVYILTKLIPNLHLDNLQGSLYGYITDELKYTIHSANLKIQTQRASEYEAIHLARPLNEPLVCIEESAFLDNGQLLAYTISKHTCESFQFRTIFVKV